MNLREIFDKHLECDPYVKLEDFQQAIADYEKSKWVSVGTEKPPHYIKVLLLTEREFHRAELIVKGFYDEKYNSYHSLEFHEDEDVKVTHWQPLPKPPKP